MIENRPTSHPKEAHGMRSQQVDPRTPCLRSRWLARGVRRGCAQRAMLRVRAQVKGTGLRGEGVQGTVEVDPRLPPLPPRGEPDCMYAL